MKTEAYQIFKSQIINMLLKFVVIVDISLVTEDKISKTIEKLIGLIINIDKIYFQYVQ